MQHIAPSTLSWSVVHQVYERSDAKLRELLHMTIEDPAWFAWLDEASSFAFHGQRGSFTARKETKQRGAVYWYAYRKREGKLAKKYLGKTADLTLTRLEEVAGVLPADRATAASILEPAPSPPTQHETALPHALADESWEWIR
jgi:LuxR family maltose regulon positive regulatory protein